MRSRWILISLSLLTIAVVSTLVYQHSRQTTIPGIAKTNGRIEVQRIDIASQYPGRLVDIKVKEGDWVQAGDIIGSLDTVELNAQLLEARALARQAKETIRRANATLEHQQAQFRLAQVQLERARELSHKGFASTAELDQRTAEYDVAKAAVSSAQVGITEAMAAHDAAKARVATLQATINNMTLVAPVAGRVEYRLAEPGTVIAAGARVVTLLDLTDVYMTVFVPAPVAGRLAIGAEARVKLDAISEYTIPARISYVADDAQFTPKSVETPDERTTFMYRVKLSFDAGLLKTYQSWVKAGMTGDAYLITDPDFTWPDVLAIQLPERR